MVYLERNELKAIAENEREIRKYSDIYGSVKEGIRVYLDLALMDRGVFEERSANELSFTFCNFSSEFMADLENDMDRIEFRESIRQNARGMEPETALLYVMALKEAHEISAPVNMKEYLRQPTELWNPEDFQRKIRDIAADPGEFSLEDRIEQIIDGLEPNLLASPLLQKWDEDLIDAAWAGEIRETLGSFEEHTYDRAEEHAIHMASFYIEVAAGRIAGISEKASPDMVALFYAAEEEICEVYRGLKGGELDKVQAQSRLRKILEVVSYRFADLLIILLEGGTIAAVFATMMALDFSFTVSIFVTCAFAAVYLSAMANFNWDIINMFGDLARDLECDILANRAKKQRQKLAMESEW